MKLLLSTILFFSAAIPSMAQCNRKSVIFGKVTLQGMAFPRAQVWVREGSAFGHVLVKATTSKFGWYEVRVPTCRPIHLDIAYTMYGRVGDEEYPDANLELPAPGRYRQDFPGVLKR